MDRQTSAKKFKILGVTQDVTTCTCCGKADLKKTVVLEVVGSQDQTDSAIEYYGSSCAARALNAADPVRRATGPEVLRIAERAALKQVNRRRASFEAWLDRAELEASRRA